jgi:Tfp pilus assembly protein PilZ
MVLEDRKKRSPRANIDLSAVIEIGGKRLVGKIRNISDSGAFICCKEPLQEGEEFALLIILPKTDHRLLVRAKVLRSNIHCVDESQMPCGMGVKFTGISNAHKEYIAKLVSEHLTHPDRV